MQPSCVGASFKDPRGKVAYIGKIAARVGEALP